MAMVYVIFLGVGFFQGATDPLRPLQARSAHVELPFQRIKSIEDLNAQVATANGAGKTVMLDFYADWCVSCKEMEKYTFAVPEVQRDLAGYTLLKADVTANNEADQALLRRFGVYGPPTTAFFGTHGRECRAFRLVGFVEADDFRSHLSRFASECG
jgi:thiol:disulfide interchange protein DsbD